MQAFHPCARVILMPSPVTTVTKAMSVHAWLPSILLRSAPLCLDTVIILAMGVCHSKMHLSPKLQLFMFMIPTRQFTGSSLSTISDTAFNASASQLKSWGKQAKEAQTVCSYASTCKVRRMDQWVASPSHVRDWCVTHLSAARVK